MDTFATFNESYVAGFGSHRPARSTIGVASLPAGGTVEIEAWAYVPVAKSVATKSAAAKSVATKFAAAKSGAAKTAAAKPAAKRKKK